MLYAAIYINKNGVLIMNKKILIIEDDNEINHMLKILLESNGYTTASAYSGTEGILVHGDDTDLILLDLMLYIIKREVR